MAYQRPLVLVYQEYAQLSVATQVTSLLPCIIGPCYHIIDLEEDEELAFLGEIDSSGYASTDFPNNIVGSLVVESSVEVKIAEPVALMSASEEVSDGMTDNTVSFLSETEYPAYVAVGDIVDIVESDNGDAEVISGAKVIAVDPVAFEIKLNRSATTASVSLGVTIRREIDDYTLTSETGGFTVAGNEIEIASQVTLIDEVSYTVESGKAYIGYKAMRQDLSDIGTVYNTDEVLATLGKMVPENPLAYGVMLTIANTTTGVKYIGVDTDDVAGYTAAKDRLGNEDDVYSLVPLTQDTAITSIFKTHAEQMSLPENGKRRIAIVSSALQTTEDISTGTDCKITEDSDTNPRLIRDTTGNFLSDGVDAGHTLEISTEDGTASIDYTVESVLSEDMLLVSEDVDIVTTFPSADEVYPYRVYKTLDKTEQAEKIAEVSDSFGYQRCVHVWPGTIIQDGVELPGYYLGCAVAGMVSGLPSHQGFTRLSISGIGQLKYANTYFNSDQLDIIANGGTFIFLQENPSAAPYVRHQLTTDMGAIEFQELSFVKNFDYVSKLCQETLDRYLGEYNICDSTLALLETAVRAVLESLKLGNLPKIGSPVRGYDITSVAQLDDIRTRVEMYVEIDFPYPLNTIGLHLISR